MSGSFAPRGSGSGAWRGRSIRERPHRRRAPRGNRFSAHRSFVPGHLPRGEGMRRIIRRSIGITFIAALIACSQDGRAATEPQRPAAAPAGPSGAPLFRDAAQQTAPQQAEAAVARAGFARAAHREGQGFGREHLDDDRREAPADPRHAAAGAAWPAASRRPRRRGAGVPGVLRSVLRRAPRASDAGGVPRLVARLRVPHQPRRLHPHEQPRRAGRDRHPRPAHGRSRVQGGVGRPGSRDGRRAHQAREPAEGSPHDRAR